VCGAKVWGKKFGKKNEEFFLQKNEEGMVQNNDEVLQRPVWRGRAKKSQFLEGLVPSLSTFLRASQSHPKI
jgi:hypothetical protein